MAEHKPPAWFTPLTEDAMQGLAVQIAEELVARKVVPKARLALAFTTVLGTVRDWNNARLARAGSVGPREDDDLPY